MRSSTGRRLCDLCSDPIEDDEHRTRVDGRPAHVECASEADRAAAA